MSFVSVLTRKAIADVTRRKGRTILVILGILIGVLGLTAVDIASDTIGGAFIYSHDQSTVPNMTFSVQAANPSIVAALAKIPNVEKVQVRVQYTSRWHISGGSGAVSIQINGYDDFQHIQLGTFQLSSGRLPGPGEIVMDSSDSAYQSIALGDTVTIDTPGGSTLLHVVGLALTSGRALAHGSALTYGYMRADALQQIARSTAPYVILVKSQDTNRASQTFDAVSRALNAAHIMVYNASLYDTTSGEIAVNGMISVIRVLAIIALLLTCFLIMNTVTTLVTEQMKIIGTMKAIGGTRWMIMRSYLVSVGIYSFVGTVLGIGLGIAGGYQLATLFAMLARIDLGPFQVSPWVIVISGAIGILVPLLAALLPLWAGTRITVREAMAAYGVNTGSGKRASVWGRHLTWVPQTVWLGLRGTFRKPVRTLLTLLALTLSGAVFIAVQTTAGSIGYTLDQVSNAFTSDVNVTVGPSSYRELRKIVQSLPNVERIEPRDSETVTTARGDLEVTGLEADTQFYQPHLLAGRWLADHEHGTIVISDLAAQRLGVHVGDRLALHEDTYRATWQIVGIVHDLTAQVGSGPVGTAFTTLENLNAFFKAPADTTTMLMLGARDHAQQAVDLLARQLDTTLHGGEFNAQITTRQQNVEQVQSTTLIIFILFYAVAMIVALVGLLGLFNTLSTSVLERRLEIGILRSVGAIGRRVATVFWIEGIALALISWALGVVLGLPGAYGLVSMLSALIEPLDFFFNPMLILSTLLFVVAITFLASFGPAIGAARVRVRDVLRYE